MKNTTRETGKKNKSFLRRYVIQIIVFLLIASYAIYFGYLSILRYKTLYASYFDLGIMHQTVYNTYRALATQDWSRILEMTNPYGPNQIKRMAIHNDILLAFLAPFYFINSTPSTLLIIQSVVLALGGFAVYLLSRDVFRKYKWSGLMALVFVIAYLLYPPLQDSNLFDFHAVTLATTFLLFAFYFWRKKYYGWSLLLIILSLLAKEEVGMTTSFFAVYAFFVGEKNRKNRVFAGSVMIISLVWFALSVSFITPFFRGSEHFALKYFSDYGDTPSHVLEGFILKPISFFKDVFDRDTFIYLFQIWGPVLFLVILSPAILIASPELGINLLSTSANMRNIYFHYTAVITPFIFIAAILGTLRLLQFLKRFTSEKKATGLVLGVLFVTTLLFSYYESPLPYSKSKQIHPFKYPAKEAADVTLWANTLKSETLKISTTGQLAPLFTSRRYFYTFADWYDKADFVILRRQEVFDYPDKMTLVPAYEKLIKDPRYKLIFNRDNLEVYRKVL